MKITAQNSEDFSAQLEEFLKQPECISEKGIVYFWKVEQPIPRKMGESNILYIGQSKDSLNDRYLKSSAFKIEMGYFDKYYKDLIASYGGLFIEIENVDDPVRAEWDHMESFKSKHGELPPLNFQNATTPKTEQ